MDVGELGVFLLSGFLTVRFLMKWYAPIFFAWPAERGVLEKNVLGFLPIAALCVIVPTLLTLASFDVVDDPTFILFYIAFGFAWLYGGIYIMDALFDLSWRDDILGMNNKSALYAFAGGFLGLTAIYAGANVGDGPGWWCVLFAGGLGVVAWVALALLINFTTHVFERITVERNVASGVRFGCYLLASGIILGWASSGDWTSFSMTVIEFGIGWPAVPLAVIAMTCELLFLRNEH